MSRLSLGLTEAGRFFECHFKPPGRLVLFLDGRQRGTSQRKCGAKHNQRIFASHLNSIVLIPKASSCLEQQITMPSGPGIRFSFYLPEILRLDI